MKAAILNLLLTHQFSCESLTGKRPRHREDAIVITISTPNNVDYLIIKVFLSKQLFSTTGSDRTERTLLCTGLLKERLITEK